jgi:transposase
MARPSKLTPDVQARICEAVRAGNYLDVASEYGGVSAATFHRWIARGVKDTKGPYVAFRAAIEKAERDAEVALVATWRRQAIDNWQAAAALLERRYGKRWGRRQTVEAIVQEELRLALERLRGVLDPTTFRKVVDALASAAGGESDPDRVGGE